MRKNQQNVGINQTNSFLPGFQPNAKMYLEAAGNKKVAGNTNLSK